jgi:hypothetical protein
MSSSLVTPLEQALGSVLMALALLDVFLTVLYARIGTGIFSTRLARLVWWLAHKLAHALGRAGAAVLTFCGPAILTSLILAWALLLSLGAALIIHPALGTAVRASSGATATDFVTALYVGGSSLSIVGASDYGPQTTGFQLIFLFNSLVGLSVTSLTISYLMQVYNALLDRNVAGLTVHLQTGETGDAAELLAGWGPRGQFSGGYSNMSDLASEMTSVKESHHFYPVLFYFRFRKPGYSVSRMTFVSLDAVALIQSALDDERHGWLKGSASLVQLERACTILVSSLDATFLSRGRRPRGRPVGAPENELRERYARAVRRLQQAKIETRKDAQAGADQYVALRRAWDSDVLLLGTAMGYDANEVTAAPAST